MKNYKFNKMIVLIFTLILSINISNISIKAADIGRISDLFDPLIQQPILDGIRRQDSSAVDTSYMLTTEVANRSLSFNFSGRQLANLNNMNYFKNIVVLNLNNCDLADANGDIKQFVKDYLSDPSVPFLDELDMQNNNITKLSDSYRKRIGILELNYNPIIEVNGFTLEDAQFMCVNLSNTQISKANIISILSNNPDLDTLNLNNNNYHSFFPELLGYNLTVLDLNYNNIEYVSSALLDSIRQNQANVYISNQGPFVHDLTQDSSLDLDIDNDYILEGFEGIINLANKGITFNIELFDDLDNPISYNRLFRASLININTSNNTIKIDKGLLSNPGTYKLKLSVSSYDEFSGTSYTFKINAKIVEYTLNYDSNGGQGTISDTKLRYGIGKDLNANLFTRDGYIFKGWNSNQAKANDGDVEFIDKANITLNVRNNMTLYAVWQKDLTQENKDKDKDSTITNNGKSNNKLANTGSMSLCNMIIAGITIILCIVEHHILSQKENN